MSYYRSAVSLFRTDSGVRSPNLGQRSLEDNHVQHAISTVVPYNLLLYHLAVYHERLFISVSGLIVAFIGFYFIVLPFFSFASSVSVRGHHYHMGGGDVVATMAL